MAGPVPVVGPGSLSSLLAEGPESGGCGLGAGGRSAREMGQGDGPGVRIPATFRSYDLRVGGRLVLAGLRRALVADESGDGSPRASNRSLEGGWWFLRQSTLERRAGFGHIGEHLRGRDGDRDLVALQAIDREGSKIIALAQIPSLQRSQCGRAKGSVTMPSGENRPEHPLRLCVREHVQRCERASPNHHGVVVLGEPPNRSFSPRVRLDDLAAGEVFYVPRAV